MRAKGRYCGGGDAAFGGAGCRDGHGERIAGGRKIVKRRRLSLVSLLRERNRRCLNIARVECGGGGDSLTWLARLAFCNKKSVCLPLCSHSARLAVRVNNAVLKKRRQTKAGTNTKTQTRRVARNSMATWQTTFMTQGCCASAIANGLPCAMALALESLSTTHFALRARV